MKATLSASAPSVLPCAGHPDSGRMLRPAAVVLVGLLATGLTGCYVVPAHHGLPPAPVVVAPAPPAPVVMTARLYPANELAAASGTVVASVSNDLHGRGTFTVVIDGERFQGEATRLAGSSREGLANGAGQRGNFLTCRYTMNSTQLGTGQCKLSNGALFAMHIGG